MYVPFILTHQYPTYLTTILPSHRLSGAAYVKSTAAAEAEKADDDFDVLNESVDVVEGMARLHILTLQL